MSVNSRDRQDEFDMNELLSFLLNDDNPRNLPNINRILSPPPPAPPPSPVDSAEDMNGVVCEDYEAFTSQAFRSESEPIRDGGYALNPVGFCPYEQQTMPVPMVPLISDVQSCNDGDDEQSINGDDMNSLAEANEDSVQGGDGLSLEEVSKIEEKQQERSKRGRKRKGEPWVDNEERKEAVRIQNKLSAARSCQKKQQHTNYLKEEVEKLKEENEYLKKVVDLQNELKKSREKEKEEEAVTGTKRAENKLKKLRSTLSSPW